MFDEGDDFLGDVEEMVARFGYSFRVVGSCHDGKAEKNEGENRRFHVAFILNGPCFVRRRVLLS
jgi:hypothetical protein